MVFKPHTDCGLLLLRVAIGSLMLVHGVQKILAYGTLKETFPDPLGMGSQLSLLAAIGAEVGGSLLLIFGLGTRLAAIPLAVTMAIAAFVVHRADPWKVKELAVVYLAVYLAFLCTGAGRWSVDAYLASRGGRKST